MGDFSKMADKILQRIRHLTRFKGYFKGPKDQQIASVSSQGSSKNGPSGPNITPLEPSWKDPPGPYISAEDKYLANPTMKPRTQEDLCKYVEDAKWKNWFTYDVCHPLPKGSMEKRLGSKRSHDSCIRAGRSGLPYIDMNYVDPKKLLENLPTDEELEGT